MGGGRKNAAVVAPCLSRQPKDLYILWAEYEHWIAGTKPAKAFTRCERGANKFAFSRRLVFWRMVVSLVARGHTSDLAIDMIRLAYGRKLGVTATLNLMRKDQERGGHPKLKA